MTQQLLEARQSLAPAQEIDKFIKDLTDWRGKLLARLRKLVLEASPDLTEDWKWETPVWVCKGNVVAGGVFKEHVKLNFFKGASLKDSKKLFNAGLEAKTSRGVDFAEDSKIDEAALKELILQAVEFNKAGKKK
ncbi:MAG: DUF1801 domain-containing protein [Chloroflexi bacterium]|nr:DUF1801 domain-containing protein [Chloroflexota bacterium]